MKKILRDYKNYEKQVQLMLTCLSIISDNKFSLALKGGTAINFFFYDMPRLSVDIDLTYTNSKDNREKALDKISYSLKFMRDELEKIPSIKNINHMKESTIHIIGSNTSVKIEVNTVIRGSCYKEKMRSISKKAFHRFDMDIKMKVLDERDLWGGKIRAALDRQHPRDLFDINSLLKKENCIKDDLRQAFIFYLLSSNRPIHELLNSEIKNIFDQIYEKRFKGMTQDEVTAASLKQAFYKLKEEIHSKLTESEKIFLMSFQNKDPDWNLFPLKIKNFPSIEWKLKNIKKMDKDKHIKSLKDLEKTLSF